MNELRSSWNTFKDSTHGLNDEGKKLKSELNNIQELRSRGYKENDIFLPNRIEELAQDFAQVSEYKTDYNELKEKHPHLTRLFQFFTGQWTNPVKKANSAMAQIRNNMDVEKQKNLDQNIQKIRLQQAKTPLQAQTDAQRQRPAIVQEDEGQAPSPATPWLKGQAQAQPRKLAPPRPSTTAPASAGFAKPSAIQEDEGQAPSPTTLAPQAQAQAQPQKLAPPRPPTQAPVPPSLGGPAKAQTAPPVPPRPLTDPSTSPAALQGPAKAQTAPPRPTTQAPVPPLQRQAAQQAPSAVDQAKAQRAKARDERNISNFVGQISVLIMDKGTDKEKLTDAFSKAYDEKLLENFNAKLTPISRDFGQKKLTLSDNAAENEDFFKFLFSDEPVKNFKDFLSDAKQIQARRAPAQAAPAQAAPAQPAVPQAAQFRAKDVLTTEADGILLPTSKEKMNELFNLVSTAVQGHQSDLLKGFDKEIIEKIKNSPRSEQTKLAENAIENIKHLIAYRVSENRKEAIEAVIKNPDEFINSDFYAELKNY